MTGKSNSSTESNDFNPGLSQQGRESTALSTDYFKPESRQPEGWLNYLASLAGNVRYFDEQSMGITGNWRDLLPDQDTMKALATYMTTGEGDDDIKALAARPDMSLLLTFIDLMQHSSGQFNDVVDRHLDHYYRDVLQFVEQPETPDNAHLVLALEGVSSMTLPPGTEFDGGKDSAGIPLIYHTTEPAVLNAAAIDYIASVNKSTSDDEFLINRQVVLDMEAGVELLEPQPTFGVDRTGEDQQAVQIGFKLASQDLYLMGGKRMITLNFATDVPGEEKIALTKWKEWFDLSVTTVDGLMRLTDEQWSVTDGNSTIAIELDRLFPAIQPIEEDNIAGTINLPYLAFVLKPAHYKTLYDPAEVVLTNQTIHYAKMSVLVEDVDGLIASNGDSNHDTAKPFEPFGTEPGLATRFNFTHPELLTKNIQWADVRLEWVDRPADFDEHYKTYSYYLLEQEYGNIGVAAPGDMPDFTVNSVYFDNNALCVDSLYPGGGVALAGETKTSEADGQPMLEEQPPHVSCSDITDLSLNRLFSDDCNCLVWPKTKVNIYQSDKEYGDEATGTDGGLFENLSTVDLFYDYQFAENSNTPQVSFPMPVNNVATNQFRFAIADNNTRYNYQELPFDLLDAEEWPKWYSLEFTNHDLGHNTFPYVVEYFSYKNGVALTTQDPTTFTPFQVLEPYTPVLQRISLNYQCDSSMSSMEQPLGNKIWFEHIAPVGRQTMDLENQHGIELLPEVDEAGYLYLGVNQVVTPGQCRIFFQVDPVDGYNMGNNPKFVWEFFANNEWHRFKRDDSQGQEGEGRVLQDSTFDLLDSGIIVFHLPKIPTGNSFNHDQRLWIRASIEKDATMVQANQDTTQLMYPIYSRLKGVNSQGVNVTLKSKGHPEEHYRQPLAAETISKLILPDPRIGSITQPFPSFGGKIKEQGHNLNRRASERLRHKQRLLTAWDYEHYVLETWPELHSVRAIWDAIRSEIVLVVIPLNHDPDVLQPKAPRFLKREISETVSKLTLPGVKVRVEDPIYVEVQLELIVKIDPMYDIQTSVIELNDLVVDTLTPWNKPDQELSKTIYLPCVAQVLEEHQAVDIIQVIRAKRKGIKGTEYSQVTPDKPTEILVPARNHKISLASVAGDVFEGIGKWEVENDFVVQ